MTSSSKTDTYKSHWDNEIFTEDFKAFKDFTLDAEEEFARKIAQILAKEIAKDDISLLDLGVGNGLVTSFFLDELLRFKSIRQYCGIDLSTALLEEASSKLEKEGNKFEISLMQADALDFIPVFTPDVILALNSWYGIPFDIIKRYREILSESGVLGIVLNSKKNLTIDVTENFKPEEAVLSSEVLMEWLEQNHIPYTKHELSIPSYSKEKFIDEKGIRPEALKFFSYLLRGDLTKIKEISDYISSKSGIYFQLPQDLILIRKSV